MSNDPYEGKSALDIAYEAEKDLNSEAAKKGHGLSSSTVESGVDEAAAQKFPGGSVTYGSAASGAGNNREIPVEEGGGIQRGTGKVTKAGDFEGGEAGEGPEDISKKALENRPGDNDVRENIRN